MGGMHPVVAVYSTFLNWAFDQVLLDVGLHRCGVTFVLNSAGVTGPDGASHHGMWDMAMLNLVPGLRFAALRDGAQLRAQLAEAVAVSDGPTVVRYPKGDLPRRRCPRSIGWAAWTCCGAPAHRTCCSWRWVLWGSSRYRSPTGWPIRASRSPWWTRGG